MMRLLRKNKISGWRRHQPLVGTPDFVFRDSKLILFVDGCFWHGCPKHSRHASKSGAFWRNKLKTNQIRDHLVTRTLRRAGWRVMRVWEHELTRKNEPRLLRRILKALAA
jgi:DNA mismatch endonuclease, patch repair protein